MDALAFGVNRLLSIKVLKGFRSFPSLFSQSDQAALFFFFSGKSIGCLETDSGRFQMEPLPEVSVEKAVSVLKRLKGSCSARNWVFLWEPPWIFSFFDRAILLNREEIRAYALGRFLDGPKNPLDAEIESGEWDVSPAEESKHWVGAAYLEKNLRGPLGLLTSILDPKAKELRNQCEKQFSRNIEHAPLIYPVLSLLGTPDQDSLLFYGLEQSYHLQWEEKRLIEISHLPRLEEKASEHLIQDLFPKPMNMVRLGFPNDQSEIHDVELPLEKMVSAWNGMARDPQKGFAWIPPSRKGYSPIWLMLIPLIFLIPVFLYYWVGETDRHLEQMHSELQTLEQKLDAQRRQVRESEQVQKQLKKLENSRKQFAFQQQQRNQLLDGLEKLFFAVGGAWIEQIRYHQHGMELSAYAEDPMIVPGLLERLSGLPDFEKARLMSRSKVKIQGRDVIRISVKMKLSPLKSQESSQDGS